VSFKIPIKQRQQNQLQTSPIIRAPKTDVIQPYDPSVTQGIRKILDSQNKELEQFASARYQNELERADRSGGIC